MTVAGNGGGPASTALPIGLPPSVAVSADCAAAGPATATAGGQAAQSSATTTPPSTAEAPFHAEAAITPAEAPLRAEAAVRAATHRPARRIGFPSLYWPAIIHV